jgi:hypothetical protein
MGAACGGVGLMVALPARVTTGEVIASAWGNQVIAMQDELTPSLYIENNTNEKLRVHAASGIVGTDAGGMFQIHRAGFTGKPVSFIGYYGTYAIGINCYNETPERMDCVAFWLSNGSVVANNWIAMQYITFGQYVGSVDPLPVQVAPGQPIEATWGNSVIDKLDAITPKYNFDGGASKPGRMRILAGSGIVNTDVNGAFALAPAPGFVNKGVGWCGLYMNNAWLVNIYRQTETHFEGIAVSTAPGNGPVGNATLAIQYACVGYYA